MKNYVYYLSEINIYINNENKSDITKISTLYFAKKNLFIII